MLAAVPREAGRGWGGAGQKLPELFREQDFPSAAPSLPFPLSLVLLGIHRVNSGKLFWAALPFTGVYGLIFTVIFKGSVSSSSDVCVDTG